MEATHSDKVCKREITQHLGGTRPRPSNKLGNTLSALNTACTPAWQSHPCHKQTKEASKKVFTKRDTQLKGGEGLQLQLPTLLPSRRDFFSHCNSFVSFTSLRLTDKESERPCLLTFHLSVHSSTLCSVVL